MPTDMTATLIPNIVFYYTAALRFAGAVVLVPLLLVTTATAQQGTVDENVNTASTVLSAEKPYAAILTLRMWNRNGKAGALVTSSRIIQTAKDFTVPHLPLAAGEWRCVIMDEGRNALDTIVLHQPLMRRIEFPDDDGSLTTHRFPESETEVIVRFRYTAAMTLLRIEKINNQLLPEFVTEAPIMQH